MAVKDEAACEREAVDALESWIGSMPAEVARIWHWGDGAGGYILGRIRTNLEACVARNEVEEK